MKADIYSVDKRTDSVFDRLENQELGERNVELLRKFYRDGLSGDIPGESKEKITLLGYLNCFNILSHLIDFDLDQVSREELKDLVATINQGRVHPDEPNTSPWTLLDYKRALKNFYKWLLQSEDPHIVGFMSCYVADSKKPRVDPEELLSVRQVERMINHAKNPRDKALMGLMWDTGARISEFLNLNVGDIGFENNLMGVRIRHGKVGPRKLYCVESKPLVQNWLRQHPKRHDSDAPLFTILQSSHRVDGVERQSYRSAYNQLRDIGGRAGVPDKIRVNPHGWRRARATDFARKGMNQPTMCQYFGWVPGSQVPKYYIRLASRNVERAIRSMYPGLDPLEDDGPEFIGENIPEYGQTHLDLYCDKA